jgi:uncharacterized protein (TIGR00251 family)
MADTKLDNALILDVRVVPRASRSEIVGLHDGALKVRIAAPPVAAAANAALIKLLAKHFGVSKSDIAIVHGENSKNKRIRIVNITRSGFEDITR